LNCRGGSGRSSHRSRGASRTRETSDVEWEGVLEDRWVRIERDLETVGRKARKGRGDGPGQRSECLINSSLNDWA